MRKNTGFTLLELLTTVSLIGLFAGAALPNLSGLYHRRQLEQAADELALAIRQGRSLALAQNRTLWLETAAGPPATYCIATGNRCTGTVLATGTLNPVVTVSFNNRFEAIEFDGSGEIRSPLPVVGALPSAAFSHSQDTGVASRELSLLSIFGKVQLQ